MNSHKLAKILLKCPNFPIAVHANNDNATSRDYLTHGSIKVGRTNDNDVIIGNLSKSDMGNVQVVEMYYGDLYEQWTDNKPKLIGKYNDEKLTET